MKSLKKAIFPTLAAAGLLISTTAQAQDCPAGAACTDPVGFTTLSVDNGIHLLGLNLVEPVEFQGTANLGGSNDQIVVNDGSALGSVDTSASLFVIVSDGSYEGLNSTITDISGSTITLADEMPGDLSSDFTVVIRRHWTLATVFGASESELKIASGSQSAADRVWLYQPDGSFIKYFYNVNAFNPSQNGWREVGDASNTDRADVVIYFTDGFILERKTATNPDGAKLLGSVNTGSTSVAVLNGINIVGNFYPGPTDGATLAEIFGDSQSNVIINPGSQSAADRVWVFQPDGSIIKYFFNINAFNPSQNGWKEVGDATLADQSAVQIPNNGAFILERKSGDANIAFSPTF